MALAIQAMVLGGVCFSGTIFRYQDFPVSNFAPVLQIHNHVHFVAHQKALKHRKPHVPACEDSVFMFLNFQSSDCVNRNKTWNKVLNPGLPSSRRSFLTTRLEGQAAYLLFVPGVLNFCQSLVIEFQKEGWKTFAPSLF